jgi:predicted Ser/Thr protein kinase
MTHEHSSPADRGEHSPRSDGPMPAVDPAAGAPPSDDTSRSSGSLSRRATDFDLAADGRCAEADPLPGRELSGCVVEQLIAEGGMGRVYLARQRSPARGVAVKVLRPGRRSPVALRRFAREADLLARLQHPGIAQVFTAGSTMIDGEETPFFVMEHVAAAEPLVRACDRDGADIRRRLKLFHEICRAVAHGHEAGVVHRDLKPGNILVGGDGRPKVIDFGIARLEEDDAAGLTETGGFLGTRQYGSPEQCDGGPVDQRSDVYSLGVILHELLTGRLPHDLRGKTLTETARIVRDTPPAQLRIADRGLARPVEAIAAKCLAKRPADRYSSAGELAADIGRLLAGEPVVARPPGPLATGLGWCRRHRTLAASLAAALASAAAVTFVLSRPAQVSWRMPPYREVAFNLLGDEWRQYVVSLDGVRFHAEQSAGKAVYFQPTKAGAEGSIVMRFPVPFPVQAAALTAAIAVWTTGDPFPYDPGAKAAVDVSTDGVTWTTLETLEANRGGFGGGPFEIGNLLADASDLWVRARLTATREWPKDGLIFAQFLRSAAQHPAERPFRLTFTGHDPDAKPPPPGTPPADG